MATRSKKAPWPPIGPGGPPTPTRTATREWPEPRRFVPSASFAAVAPAGMVAFILGDQPARGAVVIWETFFAGFDAPKEVASIDGLERWCPGAPNGLFVISPDAVVLTVEGSAGIDSLAALFADTYGMVWRLPVAGPPRYEVVLPLAFGVNFPELRTTSAAAASRLDGEWTVVTLGCEPTPADRHHLCPVRVTEVPYEVRHMHGQFLATAYQPRFKSPLDVAPDDGKAVDLPAPLAGLVRELGMTSEAPKLKKVLRPALLMEPSDQRMEDPELGGSRLGGPADLPSEQEWPSYGGAPMRLLLQLRLADVVAHDTEGVLPHEGHLWIFVNADLESSSSVSPKKRHLVLSALHLPGTSTLVRRGRPAGGDLPAHPFTLRPAATVPSVRSPHLNVEKLVGDYHTLHARYEVAAFGAASPCYLLGHVGQGDWRGAIKKRDVQLVQVRGTYAGMDDLDLLHVVLPEEDLAARLWSTARLETEMG